MKQLVLLGIILTLAGAIRAEQPKVPIDKVEGKTILVFTPHPDDELFGAGGTIALLNRHHNKVVIVIYTNTTKARTTLR